MPLISRSILALCLLAPAIAAAQTPSFEVATIKPNPTCDPRQGYWSSPNAPDFKASCITIPLLMRLAWNIDTSQIANQPSWLDSDLFDVSAKPEAGVLLSREELRPRLQNLLQDRFHLAIHRETRMIPGYALVVAKGGSKLIPGHPDGKVNWRAAVYAGHTEVHNCAILFLAQLLTPFVGFPVVDQTSLTGNYDINLQYAPAPEAESTLPSLFTAIRETLGLELKSRKVPVETIVIDHIDRAPTQN